MDQRGFRVDPKQSYYKINPEWNDTKPVSSGKIDPYEDGSETVGHRFRSRK